jgi:hypothetical protein
VELAGRWWNGSWSRRGRRDIWLMRDGEHWHVRARHGGVGGRELRWPPFHDEWSARAWVDRLLDQPPDGRRGWKDVTKVVRKPPEGGWSRGM